MRILTFFIGLMVAATGRAEVGASAPVWRAGAAKIVITPEKPVWMSGYAGRNKPAQGKDTDLFAKALLLEGEGGKALLITLDLCGIDRDFAGKVAAEIGKRHSLTRDRILLAVSHTHSGPVVGKNLRAMYFLDDAQSRLVDEYTASLHDKILAVVAEAFKNLAPARVEMGKGHVTFATNRRTNKEADVGTLRTQGRLKGPVDHDVPVLAIRDESGTVRAVVFGYACHATVLDGYLWSGDYPGHAQRELEASHPGAVALFWAGCGADQNPLPRRSLALAKAYGKELAEGVLAVLRGPMTPVAPRVNCRYTEIDLPFAELPSREKLVNDTRNENKYVAGRAKALLAELESKKELRGTYPYPVQAWRLGDELTWISLGGEVVVDYAHRLKKERGPLWVTAYANDVMAYIPSLRVLHEGGYEGASSMIYYGQPTVWGSRVEEQIVRAVIRLTRF